MKCIINDYKVDVLPVKGVPNSRYYVPNGIGDNIDEYVTDKDGNFHKVCCGEGSSEEIILTGGTGIEITGTFPDFTITNTAPDQIVTLTEGSNITITGTYPDFTIAASGSSIGTDELVKVSSNDTTAGYLNGKLVAGTGITLTENNDGGNETLSIINSAPDQTVVLTEGTGIDITGTYPNFTIAATGSSSPTRFGFLGEDVLATGNRNFNFDNHSFVIHDTTSTLQVYLDATAIDGTRNIYMQTRNPVTADEQFAYLTVNSDSAGLSSILLSINGLDADVKDVNINLYPGVIALYLEDNANLLLLGIDQDDTANKILSLDASSHVRWVDKATITGGGGSSQRFGKLGEDVSDTALRSFTTTNGVEIKAPDYDNYFGVYTGGIDILFNTISNGTQYGATITPGFYNTYASSNNGFANLNLISSGSSQANISSQHSLSGNTTISKADFRSFGTDANSYATVYREHTNDVNGRFRADLDGAKLQTRVNLAGTYKGLLVKPNSDFVFENYPSSRADAGSTKALYIADASGTVAYGPISSTTGQRFGFIGEDDGTSTAARFFDIGNFNFVIGNNATGGTTSGVLLQNGFFGSILDDGGGFRSTISNTPYAVQLFARETGVSTQQVNMFYDFTEITSTLEGDKSMGITLAPYSPDSIALLDISHGNGVGANTYGTRIKMRNDALYIQATATPNTDASFKGIKLALTGNLTFDNYPSSRNDGSTTKALYINNVSGDVVYGTITNSDPGSSQFIFKNIAVATQSTVVADSNNDTLTLVAGTGMTITTDASTDTIIFTAATSSSGIVRVIVSTSGSITLGSAAATDYTYFVTGAHTLSMPTAVANTNRYTIKNNHSANITVDTAGAENIEGAASLSLSPASSIDVISDGTNWYVV